MKMSSNLEPMPIKSSQRWLILAIVTLSGLLAPMASTIYLPSLVQIEDDLEASRQHVDLSVSAYLVTVGIAPLFWGAMSDGSGRRWVALVSQLILVLASLGCALAPSLEVLIVMRVLKAVGASACSVSGIGTITDVYLPHEKGRAMGIFFIGPMFGPSLGPLIGGIINQYGHWRDVFWFLMAASSVLLVATFFFLPETLARQPNSLRFYSSSKWPGFRTEGSLGNPLQTLALFRYPRVLAMLLYAGIIYGSYYNISLSHSRVMQQQYHLSSLSTGLSYLSIGTGNILGSYLGGLLGDVAYNSPRTSQSPESRLHACWPGAILIMVGLALNGFFIAFQYPLPLTLFAQFMVGLGMANVFTVSSTYLTDLLPTKASSVTACTNFMRNLVSGAVTSFSTTLIQAIGPFYLFLAFSAAQLIGIALLALLTLKKSK
ncbi:Dityrosine transporter 1 [Entomophthora muscae]|uniref:Dityrosine transporter 1 n=1 Tax=Entomophthora muscae TaxID=34485 RepID=A0ACC2U9W0_9FUNG|nr:Dityrosine transporter 1 [Entomophthora muscae]